MQRLRTFIQAVFTGISSLGAYAAPAQYKRLNGSDLDRLRGDVMRVGDDFTTVLKREAKNK